MSISTAFLWTGVVAFIFAVVAAATASEARSDKLARGSVAIAGGAGVAALGLFLAAIWTGVDW